MIVFDIYTVFGNFLYPHHTRFELLGGIVVCKNKNKLFLYILLSINIREVVSFYIYNQAKKYLSKQNILSDK